MNDRCKQLGGYLLQTDTRMEAYVVGRYVYRLGRGPFFTGITDEGSEGRFYTYNDKKPVKYINWRWFQPDNWWGEHCVEVWATGFNDRHCGSKGRYICEVPA
ncbi:pulmonary surfactant-associated protein d [Plakobranchus ocellatus]|uniref:Pulmonary surfactant-associated protein d n=1 Tax=Plakobranchus ocellatus TaxID=259542 RepID=A0AAV4BZK4_9GAST|nr:pulmonary surfactant-associated protein d [Plakobranchus ocellatus]